MQAGVKVFCESGSLLVTGEYKITKKENRDAHPLCSHEISGWGTPRARHCNRAACPGSTLMSIGWIVITGSTK